MLKHKVGSENRGRKASLLTTLAMTTTGIMSIKEDYSTSPKLGPIYAAISFGNSPLYSNYSLMDGYLFFFGNRLCLPATSIRDFVIRELHARGIVGHFGRDKTIHLVEDKFF